MNHKEWFESGGAAIKVNSQAERDTVFNLVESWGLKAARQFNHESMYPYIKMYAPKDCAVGYKTDRVGDSVPFDSLSEFLAAKPELPKRTGVLLNKTAIVITKDKVSIGYQDFTHESVLTLAELVKQFKQ